MVRLFASFALIALLAACASSQSSPGVPPGTSSSLHRISPASGSCCSIFWNKRRVNLHYGGKPQRAVLAYWGPNGYYFEPVYCKNGSQISVTTGRTFGNPSAYEHVIVKFQAESEGPARCTLIAVLNNTGSPPLAPIQLNIR
jgi:hypothetical protein